MESLCQDIVAWNEAAADLFGDYALMPRERRNVLMPVHAAIAVHRHLKTGDHVAMSLPEFAMVQRGA
ncbi:hypothetical protein N8E89_28480 (plasmid) [Phyllobacterium sp. A18/5-2]|uniref:MmyB family transcriptional regulator n=1 Tax=Phyllobacterium sp. A18/5-2 TaxID=2978392 RepID=UPI0021C87A74|nr:hypothetical protein [Phyllobacterium sp. A18/5-2]UXN67456.1 hypothetical protein N8E89_28480 [Phyllobacterium sp. A18/5-2]